MPCRAYTYTHTHARMHVYTLDVCDGTLSGQLCARAREPEVDGGALYLSLCMLSVSVMEVYGVYMCNLYKFANYTA